VYQNEEVRKLLNYSKKRESILPTGSRDPSPLINNRPPQSKRTTPVHTKRMRDIDPLTWIRERELDQQVSSKQGGEKSFNNLWSNQNERNRMIELE
jgi:hypothetical protein